MNPVLFISFKDTTTGRVITKFSKPVKKSCCQNENVKRPATESRCQVVYQVEVVRACDQR